MQAGKTDDFYEALESHVMLCTVIVFVVTIAHAFLQALIGRDTKNPWLIGLVLWFGTSLCYGVYHLCKSRGPKGRWLREQQKKPWKVLIPDLFLTTAFIFLSGGYDSGMLFLFCWCFFFASILLVPVHPEIDAKLSRVAVYCALAALAVLLATFFKENWGLDPLARTKTPSELRMDLGHNGWLVWLRYGAILLLVASFLYASVRLLHISRMYLLGVEIDSGGNMGEAGQECGI